MEINFDGDDYVVDYVTVPEGTYLCQVAEIREGVSRSGATRWSLRLVVKEGPYAGKQAAWDSLVFSDRGTPRIKRVLRAFGLSTTEILELEGREAFVQIRSKEYQNSEGRTIRRNEVPYEGYAECRG